MSKPNPTYASELLGRATYASELLVQSESVYDREMIESNDASLNNPKHAFNLLMERVGGILCANPT